MPSQKQSQAFVKSWIETNALTQKCLAFTHQVVADVRLSLRNAWIVVLPGLRLTRERQRFFRHFQLRSIAAMCDLRYSFAINIPALNVHRGIGANGILAKNRVEGDERLQFFLPRRLRDVSQSPYAGGDAL